MDPEVKAVASTYKSKMHIKLMMCSYFVTMGKLKAVKYTTSIVPFVV
jgi:hypothetical protein